MSGCPLGRGSSIRKKRRLQQKQPDPDDGGKVAEPAYGGRTTTTRGRPRPLVPIVSSSGSPCRASVASGPPSRFSTSVAPRAYDSHRPTSRRTAGHCEAKRRILPSLSCPRAAVLLDSAQ